ncbi:DUF4031 domain-containing protein [Oerskovia flava]|uniref:DUF4031 domain-containing protein n=1 Tax=Oerskovia flava TaxID=2986422 RepID=UPI00223EC748|nr:DUF4031 domain-containing protein [Oerskovia sp. JB1-3-2]
MAVLIDPPSWPAHGTVWSHLVSDSSLAELHDAAARIGLSPRSFDLDHYDVAAERYQDAVAAGAHPVSGRELVVRLAASGLRVRGRDRGAGKAHALRTRWDALLPDDHVRGARDVGHELVERWGEPHRAYHGREHLVHVLDSLALLEGRPPGLPAGPAPIAATRRTDGSRVTELAVWFHDAVHDGVARQDEERSAELAVRLLGPLARPGSGADLTPDDVDEVARLVLLTRDHDPDPADTAGSLLSDADLAILGSAPDRYARYVRQVRAEYAAVPDDVFVPARAAVLEQLLSTGALFRTVAGARRWQDRAESNLRDELAGLRA